MGIEAKNLTSVGTNLFGGSGPTGKAFSARVFVDSERYRTLDRRETYFACTQHDTRQYDFDGRILQQSSGIGYTQPYLSEKAGFYVPMRLRRPSTPYRLARAMVKAFTNFVFGQNRFPNLRVMDEDSQDFIQTCSKVGGLSTKASRARNIGGSQGTVGMSWCFRNGKPVFRVHKGKNLFVHGWEDRDELVPRHVTECYQVADEEWNPQKKKVEKVYYWKRRDWTEDAEIMFKLAPVDEGGGEPDWEQYLDVDNSSIHNDGNTHFVWIQNLPNEDDIDGFPDYEGQYESLDDLDILLSVMLKGAKMNLDPTLVLKTDMLMVNRLGIKKGSDNALVVDKDQGDAKYLELTGSSIEAGIKLFNEHRKTILEVAECVMPDPDQIAAQGQSAAAMKMVYSRMLSKGGEIQDQYGDAIKRLLEPLLYIAQQRVQVPIVQVDEGGNRQEFQQSFDLPPRVEQEDVQGDDGQPTGDKTPVSYERHPGQGTDVELEWPDRFPPTPTDKQSLATTLSTAAGSKPILSQQTATEEMAQAFGKDPDDEWKRVQADGKADDQKQQDQMAAMGGGSPGGKVPAMHQTPPGAKPPGGGGGTGAKAGAKGGSEDPDPDESGNP